MRGENKIGAIHNLGWRDVGVFSRSSTETEKDPGKMVEPIGGGSAGTEGVFEMAVEVLHQTIGLRVIGSGRLMSDIEEMAKVEPEGRCELRDTI